MLKTILKGNEKSWDEYLSYIKYAYNRVVHKTTKITHVQAVYRFNPLTLLYLLPIPKSFEFVRKEGLKSKI